MDEVVGQPVDVVAGLDLLADMRDREAILPILSAYRRGDVGARRWVVDDRIDACLCTRLSKASARAM